MEFPFSDSLKKFLKKIESRTGARKSPGSSLFETGGTQGIPNRFLRGEQRGGVAVKFESHLIKVSTMERSVSCAPGAGSRCGCGNEAFRKFASWAPGC